MSVDPLSWIEDELINWDARGLRRRLVIREGPQGPIAGWNNRRLVNFGSNDYLDLAGKSLVPAVRNVLEQCGWGSGASPLVTGRGWLHAELESALATFEGTQAALLFPSGYSANIGTIV